MADFCQQCSVKLFGDDYGDFAGISTPAETAAGLFALVLCEGCGEMIHVDHTGRRVTLQEGGDHG